MSVLAASVVAAQGAVSVLVGALGDARDEQATAVQAAAQADLVKDAAARQTEIALEANKAAFEALSATEALVDVKTAATTRLAAELAACRAVLARAVSAHDTFSRTLQETLAKLSDAVRLRERFDGAAGASKEEGVPLRALAHTHAIAMRVPSYLIIKVALHYQLVVAQHVPG